MSVVSQPGSSTECLAMAQVPSLPTGGTSPNTGPQRRERQRRRLPSDGRRVLSASARNPLRANPASTRPCVAPSRVRRSRPATAAHAQATRATWPAPRRHRQPIACSSRWFLLSSCRTSTSGEMDLVALHAPKRSGRGREDRRLGFCRTRDNLDHKSPHNGAGWRRGARRSPTLRLVVVLPLPTVSRRSPPGCCL